MFLPEFFTIWTILLACAEAAFFPTPTPHFLRTKGAPVLVPADPASANSWFLIRGYVCVKQANVLLETSDVIGLSNESEDSCVQACQATSKCKVVHWLDFTEVSNTGNQKFCSMYESFDSCEPIQAIYIEVSSAGVVKNATGRYCSSLGDNYASDAINRPVMLPAKYFSNLNESAPGQRECFEECSANVYSDGGSKCVGYNYMPQEIPSFLVGGSDVMPCWLFFTRPCAIMLEPRIFSKAETANSTKNLFHAEGRISIDDVSIVTFEYEKITSGLSKNVTSQPIANITVSPDLPFIDISYPPVQTTALPPNATTNRSSAFNMTTKAEFLNGINATVPLTTASETIAATTTLARTQTTASTTLAALQTVASTNTSALPAATTVSPSPTSPQAQKSHAAITLANWYIIMLMAGSLRFSAVRTRVF